LDSSREPRYRAPARGQWGAHGRDRPPAHSCAVRCGVSQGSSRRERGIGHGRQNFVEDRRHLSHRCRATCACGGLWPTICATNIAAHELHCCRGEGSFREGGPNVRLFCAPFGLLATPDEQCKCGPAQERLVKTDAAGNSEYSCRDRCLLGSNRQENGECGPTNMCARRMVNYDVDWCDTSGVFCETKHYEDRCQPPFGGVALQPTTGPFNSACNHLTLSQGEKAPDGTCSGPGPIVARIGCGYGTYQYMPTLFRTSRCPLVNPDRRYRALRQKQDHMVSISLADIGRSLGAVRK